ncbi:Dynein assembly factor 4, axonemal [Cichlidogyrus casuarinus]|uniref:Dynein assembly factor 4, axonemal n=1 Tax=Cichlidogyrus casuarinus TaxID=1844966 RepID=A0ABD2QCS8_9PLAT
MDSKERKTIEEGKLALTHEAINQLNQEVKKNTNKPRLEMPVERIKVFEDNLPHQKPIELPVRESKSIKIKFSQRAFPTPERESNKAAEQEWLQKQAEYKRVHFQKVVPDGDISASENDPDWLKKKGDSLFKAGDAEAAILAYSRALEINQNLFSVCSNRSAAYISLKNYRQALQDSSTALDLLKPETELNSKPRKLAHVRRGTALHYLGMSREAIVEWEAALKLDPENIQLKEDLDKIYKLITDQ